MGEEHALTARKRLDDELLSPDPAEKPDIALKMMGPVSPVTPPPSPVVSPGKTSSPAESPRPSLVVPDGAPRLVAHLVDSVVVLILAGVGVMVGEAVARKSTREILSNAGSAPKFPPIDLLLWLGCVAVFVLIYAWLGMRGRTAGGWLKRRTR